MSLDMLHNLGLLLPSAIMADEGLDPFVDDEAVKKQETAPADEGDGEKSSGDRTPAPIGEERVGGATDIKEPASPPQEDNWTKFINALSDDVLPVVDDLNPSFTLGFSPVNAALSVNGTSAISPLMKSDMNRRGQFLSGELRISPDWMPFFADWSKIKFAIIAGGGGNPQMKEENSGDHFSLSVGTLQRFGSDIGIESIMKLSEGLFFETVGNRQSSPTILLPDARRFIAGMEIAFANDSDFMEVRGNLRWTFVDDVHFDSSNFEDREVNDRVGNGGTKEMGIGADIYSLGGSDWLPDLKLDLKAVLDKTEEYPFDPRMELLGRDKSIEVRTRDFSIHPQFTWYSANVGDIVLGAVYGFSSRSNIDENSESSSFYGLDASLESYASWGDASLSFLRNERMYSLYDVSMDQLKASYTSWDIYFTELADIGFRFFVDGEVNYFQDNELLKSNGEPTEYLQLGVGTGVTFFM